MQLCCFVLMAAVLILLIHSDSFCHLNIVFSINITAYMLGE